MSVYRIKLGNGGISGYWKVQERIGIWWITRSKYSLFVYGHDEAYKMAMALYGLLVANERLGQ